MNTFYPGAALMALVGLTLATVPVAADAQEQYRLRRLVQISTGVCDPYAPATDTQILREPTGIRNVSNTTVRLSCSLLADLSTLAYPAAVGGLRSFGVTFRNPTGAAVNVVCTASVGRQITGFTNNTKAVAVAAGGTGTIVWNITADYPAVRLPGNFVCALPRGVIAGETYSTYYEGVGT